MSNDDEVARKKRIHMLTQQFFGEDIDLAGGNLRDALGHAERERAILDVELRDWKRKYMELKEGW